MFSFATQIEFTNTYIDKYSYRIDYSLASLSLHITQL